MKGLLTRACATASPTLPTPCRHPVWLPEGVQRFLGRHPCYDPAKDLLVPPMFGPLKVADSPILGNPGVCADATLSCASSTDVR